MRNQCVIATPTQINKAIDDALTKKAVSSYHYDNAVNKAAEVDSNLIEIKSPMIGTFYRSSGPDKEPFVSVGDFY